MIIDHTISAYGTLAAATAKLLAAGVDAGVNQCRSLIIANNGINPMIVKFGSAPTSATDGIPLDPASASGGQGGSLVLTGDSAPPDAVYGYSTVGTTYSIAQGTTAHDGPANGIEIAPFTR